MAIKMTAGDLARECAESNGDAMRDLNVGCSAPDNGRWSDLYAAPSANDDGTIALNLIDWPSVNARTVNVDPGFELSAEVIAG